MQYTRSKVLGTRVEGLRDEPLILESGKGEKDDVMLVTRHRNQRV